MKKKVAFNPSKLQTNTFLLEILEELSPLDTAINFKP